MKYPFKLIFALSFVLCSLLGLSGQAWSAEVTPDEMLRQTTEEILTLVKQDRDLQSGDKQKAYALVETHIVPRFDFVRMTRLALGKNWNKATPEQQAAVVEAFRNLLVRTYSSAITRFHKETFTYKPWVGKAEDVTTSVQSVVSDGSRSVPIDYAMARVDNTWKVYDIKVDGISLVTNYRSDFNDRINAAGIDGLIKDLQEKARIAGQAADNKSVKKGQ
jgi:phospholipid transport system substrate-binding protein